MQEDKSCLLLKKTGKSSISIRIPQLSEILLSIKEKGYLSYLFIYLLKAKQIRLGTVLIEWYFFCPGWYVSVD